MPNETKQRFYPSPSDFPSHAQYDAHRQLYDQHYELLDRVNKMEKSQQTPTQSAPNGSPSSLNGINVIGSPTKDKSVLQFNATTGQAEWVAPTT